MRVSLLLMRDLAMLAVLLLSFIVAFGLLAATRSPESKLRRPK
jgi:hypothetical protein